MSTDLFRDSPLIQSILEEERLQTMRELAQSALEGRFQTLDADILQAIGTADEATLKAIVAPAPACRWSRCAPGRAWGSRDKNVLNGPT